MTAVECLGRLSAPTLMGRPPQWKLAGIYQFPLDVRDGLYRSVTNRIELLDYFLEWEKGTRVEMRNPITENRLSMAWSLRQ